jgi:histidine triad (HIT) family protein
MHSVADKCWTDSVGVDSIHRGGTEMSETIFSKIIRREIPADIVFENDDVLGFRDVNPQAPVHVLFIPKQPLATLNDATPEQGYRTVINCNEDGGQTVFHIHVHLLAGRRLHWPPG